MNLLAIGAHPDDIEFGCGGSLIRYGRKGHSVFLLIVTEGGSGGIGSVRRAEQLNASKILQAKEVFFSNYSDTQIPIDKALITKIEETLRSVKPELIFVNYPDDTHQDHRNLAMATVSATRYVQNVLFYEGPTTQNFTPNVFVDIGSVLNEKLSALNAHASQVCKTNIEGLSILEIAKAAATFRGIQGRVTYAEGFVSERLFLTI
ncbi:MAG: PIG-L family deacetylase [Planctomycetes bacterium]|uniref:PIG-L deacetylase family protein n=1 Tax=Candidatus Wunengus sp. YC60 TaxID=3367697 RepID=UPI004024F303|nr:PIG-L family deacetylase [Planctomycetota bacterium]